MDIPFDAGNDEVYTIYVKLLCQKIQNAITHKYIQ